MQKEPPSVIQVVGYKNAGKTTLISKMISYLTSRKLRVASLKHHGHDSSLQKTENTDSTRHYDAGAMMAGVCSSSELQLQITGEQFLTMERIMAIYALMDIDILLLEGFKQADYPKIVLLRDESDEALLRLSNIIAVGASEKNFSEAIPFMTFSLDDMDRAVPWLVRLGLADKTDGYE